MLPEEFVLTLLINILCIRNGKTDNSNILVENKSYKKKIYCNIHKIEEEYKIKCK